ncbi:cholinephosphotransferase 1 [Macrotis lagotis]|uniref:cholinephosphotransferase 1 n=1 Tax=Macrotis lagotis TaxID=92651 RepID=UPI003D6989BF
MVLMLCGDQGETEDPLGGSWSSLSCQVREVFSSPNRVKPAKLTVGVTVEVSAGEAAGIPRGATAREAAGATAGGTRKVSAGETAGGTREVSAGETAGGPTGGDCRGDQRGVRRGDCRGAHGGRLPGGPERCPQGRLQGGPRGATASGASRAGGPAGLRAAWAPAAPLSPAQLRRLEEHRYSAAGTSLLEPLLQPFWRWLVTLVPLWVAPNAITVAGLLVNLLSTLLLVCYCPTATEQAPLWMYITCGLAIFIYQSLDAIDGKQARRTNCCSPLGELIDHGCDSISTVFVSLGASIAVGLGSHPNWLFFCCFIGMFLFYCAHWETYVSGVLRFRKVDVTEVQLAIVVIFFITSIGGSAMWDYSLPVIGIKLKVFPFLGIAVGAFFSCSNSFHTILNGGVGKNGSTIAGTSVLSPGIHIGLIILLAIMICKKSSTQLFEKHPCLYIIMFGCVYAKVTQKLVVAHMTKSRLTLQDPAYIGPGLLFLDQYFNNFIDEYTVLWAAMFISSLDLLRYSTAVILQIANHFQLHIFRIPHLPAPEQVQNH